MRTTITRGLVLVTAATLATVGTAGTAQASDTTTTFIVDGGAMSISAPAAADLGEVATGAASVQGSLGPVTVTDERGALVAEWGVTASSSNFTTGGATAAETVPKANVLYTPGATTASSPATGVFTPTPGALGLPLPIYTGAAVGNNSATWNPTITITLPAQAVAGTYTGTITHSFS